MSEGREVQWVDIAPEQAGQRIDNFLMTRLKGAPRALIYRIVRKGEVRVNKKRVKVDYRLQAGDLVRVPPLRLAPKEAVKEVSDNLRDLLVGSVIMEGPDWMVLNKPSGLAVHGGSGVKRAHHVPPGMLGRCRENLKCGVAVIRIVCIQRRHLYAPAQGQDRTEKGVVAALACL